MNNFALRNKTYREIISVMRDKDYFLSYGEICGLCRNEFEMSASNVMRRVRELAERKILDRELIGKNALFRINPAFNEGVIKLLLGEK